MSGKFESTIISTEFRRHCLTPQHKGNLGFLSTYTHNIKTNISVYNGISPAIRQFIFTVHLLFYCTAAITGYLRVVTHLHIPGLIPAPTPG